MTALRDFCIYSLALIGATVVGAALREHWTGESTTLTGWDMASAFVVVGVVQFALPWVIDRLRDRP